MIQFFKWTKLAWHKGINKLCSLHYQWCTCTLEIKTDHWKHFQKMGFKIERRAWLLNSSSCLKNSKTGLFPVWLNFCVVQCQALTMYSSREASSAMPTSIAYCKEHLMQSFVFFHSVSFLIGSLAQWQLQIIPCNCHKLHHFQEVYWRQKCCFTEVTVVQSNIQNTYWATGWASTRVSPMLILIWNKKAKYRSNPVISNLVKCNWGNLL